MSKISQSYWAQGTQTGKKRKTRIIYEQNTPEQPLTRDFDNIFIFYCSPKKNTGLDFSLFTWQTILYYVT